MKTMAALMAMAALAWAGDSREDAVRKLDTMKVTVNFEDVRLPEGAHAKLMKPGRTAEDLVRYLVFCQIADLVTDEWLAPQRGPKLLAVIGLNAAALLKL